MFFELENFLGFLSPNAWHSFSKETFLISSPHLTSIDRMGLFDDQVAMVLCEETGDTVRILRMAQTFREYERSITVWRCV